MKNILYIIAALMIFISMILLHFGTFYYHSGVARGMFLEIAEVVGRSIAYMPFFYIFWKGLTSSTFMASKKGNSLLCYCVLFLLLSCYQVTTIIELKKSEKKIDDMAKSFFDISNLLSSLGPEEIVCLLKGFPEMDPPSFSTKEFGEMAPLLILVREVFDYSHQELVQLLSLCKNSDLKDFNLDSFCDYAWIQKKEISLNIVTKDINESEARLIKYVEQSDAKIKSMASQYNEKQTSILESYQQRKFEILNNLKELYRIEREFYLELRELMQYLISIHGSYRHGDGGLVFEINDHADKFSKHILRMSELSTEEQKILNKLYREE